MDDEKGINKDKMFEYLIANEETYLESLEFVKKQITSYQEELSRQDSIFEDLYNKQENIERDSVFYQAYQDEMDKIYDSAMLEMIDKFEEKMMNLKKKMIADARDKLKKDIEQRNKYIGEIMKKAEHIRGAIIKNKELLRSDVMNEELRGNVEYLKGVFDAYCNEYKEKNAEKSSYEQVVQGLENFEKNEDIGSNLEIIGSLLSEYGIKKEKTRQPIVEYPESKQPTPEASEQPVSKQPAPEASEQPASKATEQPTPKQPTPEQPTPEPKAPEGPTGTEPKGSQAEADSVGKANGVAPLFVNGYDTSKMSPAGYSKPEFKGEIKAKYEVNLSGIKIEIGKDGIVCNFAGKKKIITAKKLKKGFKSGNAKEVVEDLKERNIELNEMNSIAVASVIKELQENNLTGESRRLIEMLANSQSKDNSELANEYKQKLSELITYDRTGIDNHKITTLFSRIVNRKWYRTLRAGADEVESKGIATVIEDKMNYSPKRIKGKVKTKALGEGEPPKEPQKTRDTAKTVDSREDTVETVYLSFRNGYYDKEAAEFSNTVGLNYVVGKNDKTARQDDQQVQ